MSITHPFGSDVESMSEFYGNFFLRAVTLFTYMYITTCHVHFTFYLYLYLYLYLYPLCIAHPKRDHCAKEKRMLLLKHFPVWQLQFRSVFWEAHLKLLEVDLSHVKTAKPKARVIY